MLGFALPALGIFLSNPLLSNIDNAFAGRFTGTRGLAALSPATIGTDQVLYLCSFLSRATTGLVSRAYAGGDTEAARRAAATPLTVSLLIGALLSSFYALYTPWLLTRVLGVVDPTLLPAAASYVYWRGSIAWAALGQNVALSISLATGDAWTPLKIIGAAAFLNVVGDFVLCAWPWQLGVAGAAAATSLTTVCSGALLCRSLMKRGLWPRLKVPPKAELKALNEFTGPLLAITMTRLIGFVAMQRKAMTLGVQSLAAYQLCINILIFFILFGEPLSQLSQTQLPALIDRCEEEDDGDTTSTPTLTSPSLILKQTLSSIGMLAGWGSLVVGTVSFATVAWGSALFTRDAAVLSLAGRTAPVIGMVVTTSIATIAIDGAMLASRDFGFMLSTGLSTMTLQLLYLRYRANSLAAIFATFAFRLGTYGILCCVRAALGYGTLGRALRSKKKKTTTTNKVV